MIQGKRARALQMRLDGHTYAQIAIALGVHRSRAYQLAAQPAEVVRYLAKLAKGKCQNCGVDLGASGDIHQKGCRDLAKEDYGDIANLIYVCKSCHRKALGTK